MNPLEIKALLDHINDITDKVEKFIQAVDNGMRNFGEFIDSIPGKGLNKGGVSQYTNPLAKTAESFGFLGEMIGIVIRGFGILGDITAKTSDQFVKFSKTEFAAGGGANGAAGMEMFGNGIDKSGGDMAKMARTFGDQLYSNPQARIMFEQEDLPGIFGKVDKADQMIEAINSLRQMSEPQAIQAARAGGVEDLLMYRNLSQKTMNALAQDRTDAAITNDHVSQANAAELQTRMNRIGSLVGTLYKQILGDHVVNGANVITDPIVKALEALTKRNDETKLAADKDKQKALEQAIKNGEPRGRQAAKDAGFGDMTNAEALAKVKTDVQDDLNRISGKDPDGNRNMNVIFPDNNRDFYGGGDRLHGAIPAHWRMQVFGQQNYYQSLKVGAFGT